MGKAFCIKVETNGLNQARDCLVCARECCCGNLTNCARQQAFWAKDTPDQNAWIEALTEATKPPPPPPVVIDHGSNSNHSQDIKINVVTPGGSMGPQGMDPMMAYQQQAMMQAQYQQQLQYQQTMMRKFGDAKHTSLIVN